MTNEPVPPLFPSISGLINAFNQSGVFAERMVYEHCLTVANAVNKATATNELSKTAFKDMVVSARFLFIEDVLLDTFAVSCATLNRWSTGETSPGPLVRLYVAQQFERLLDDPKSPLPYNTMGIKPKP